MSVGGIFPEEEKQIFSEGDKSGAISFYN